MQKFFKQSLKFYWSKLVYGTRALYCYNHIKKILRPQEIIILLYHRVVPRNIETRLCSPKGIIVYEENFDQQMKYIKENFNVIHLGDYLKARHHGNLLPKRSLMITFDDGMEDNYLYAFPILKKYELSATIALTTDYIGGKKLFWHQKIFYLVNQLKLMSSPIEKLRKLFSEDMIQSIHSVLSEPKNEKKQTLLIDRLKTVDIPTRNEMIHGLETLLNIKDYPIRENAFLNWDQVSEMSKFNIDFGSHGASHEILSELSANEICHEATSSKAIIESHLGHKIDSFAYPNGSYNDSVIGMIRTAGYSCALTTQSGFNNPKDDLYKLRRFSVHEGRTSDTRGVYSKARFATYISGLMMSKSTA